MTWILWLEIRKKEVKIGTGTCLYLLHDALLIVVAERSAQLVIVHGRPVLLDSPASGHLDIPKHALNSPPTEKATLINDLIKLYKLTSSGSISLNSSPRPVHAIKWLLDGSSNSVTRNCQSCNEPRLWYGGPSLKPTPSCLHFPSSRSGTTHASS